MIDTNLGRGFCAVWNDGSQWIYAIDPICPQELKDEVREIAIAWCEEMIFKEAGKVIDTGIE